MNGNEFRKRPGTTDQGKEYENILVAYYSLQFAINDDIEDFKISSNDDKSGNFDDIILEISWSNGKNERYDLQAKHKQTNKNNFLRVVSLQAATGKFSIKKLFSEYKKNPSQDQQKLVMFTNRKMESGETEILTDQNFIINITPYKNKQEIVNTSNINKYSIYALQLTETINPPNKTEEKEIKTWKDFCKRFLLYTNQKNVDELKKLILNIFLNILKCSEVIMANFLEFINKWSNYDGKKEKLTKKFVREKIAQCMLFPYVYVLPHTKWSEKCDIIKKAVHAVDITFVVNVKAARDIYQENGLNNEELEIINQTGKKYQIISKHVKNSSDISPKEHMILLWLLDLRPLVLKATKSNKDTIFQAINLCQFKKGKKKFIILGTTKSLPGWKTFYGISDLLPYVSLYNQIITLFNCSLQGRNNINIRELIDSDTEMLKIITTDQLFLMLDGDFNIGGPKENLPEHYIHRFLSKIIFKFDVIEKLIDTESIVISCKNQFNVIQKYIHNTNLEANILYVDDDADFLNSPNDNTTEFFGKSSIFIAENLCSPEMFDNISKTFPARPCHHFQIDKEGYLEWLESYGSSENLISYKPNFNVFLNETSIFNLTYKINVICDDPGMGKSILMSSLKNNYPSKFWVIKVLLREHSNFFEESSNSKEFLNRIIDNLKLDQFAKNVVNILKEKRRIVLMWDGLDEISETSLKNVLKVIENFLQLGYVQWITARTNLRRTLEEKFNIFARKIKSFDKDDQTNYINKRLESCNLENIDRTVEGIMKHVDNDHLSIPLHIFMLTELFRHNNEKCKTLLINSFSITDLFDYFVEEKFNFLYKKSNIDLSNDVAKQIINEHKSNRLENYQLVALYLCLDQKILSTLRLNSCQNFLDYVKKNDDCFGILEVVNNIPHFAHRTYAEYFVALWLSKHYTKIPNLQDFFFEESFKNIRFMFDLILAKDCPAHVAALYKYPDGVQHNLDKLNLEDKAGRSPLHVAASWGEAHCVPNTKREGKKFVITTEKECSIKEDSLNYKQVVDLLASQCSIKQQDTMFKFNPLQYADRSLSLTSIDIISKFHPININTLTNFKDLSVILYYAVKFNYDNLFEMVKEIPYIEADHNETLLHLIAFYNRPRFLEKVLENKMYKNSINKPDRKGWAPIHHACCSGNLEMIKALRKSGGDIKLGSKTGEETPLHVAAQHGQISVLKYLINNKVDVDISKEKGWTPLMVATQKCMFDAVKVLVEHKADVNRVNRDGSGPLYIAARKGNVDIVKFLISKKAEVNILTKHCETPLYIASKLGYLSICKLLIENGAQVNIPKKNGWTPLMVATRNGHLQIVKLLVENKARINSNPSESRFLKFLSLSAPSRNLPNPLHIAAEKGDLSMVNYFIQKGADVNLVMNNGWSALYKAVNRGHFDVVKCLIQHGAKIDATLKDGWSPVFKAAEKGYSDIVKCLVEHNATVSVLSKDGYNPLTVAQKNGHSKIVSYLEAKKILDQAGPKAHIAFLQVLNHMEDKLLKTSNTNSPVDKVSSWRKRTKWLTIGLLTIVILSIVILTSTFLDILIKNK